MNGQETVEGLLKFLSLLSETDGARDDVIAELKSHLVREKPEPAKNDGIGAAISGYLDGSARIVRNGPRGVDDSLNGDLNRLSDSLKADGSQFLQSVIKNSPPHVSVDYPSDYEVSRISKSNGVITFDLKKKNDGK